MAWKYFNFEKSRTLFIRISWRQHLVTKIKTQHPNNFLSLLGSYFSEDSAHFKKKAELHKNISRVETAVPFQHSIIQESSENPRSSILKQVHLKREEHPTKLANENGI